MQLDTRSYEPSLDLLLWGTYTLSYHLLHFNLPIEIHNIVFHLQSSHRWHKKIMQNFNLFYIEFAFEYITMSTFSVVTTWLNMDQSHKCPILLKVFPFSNKSVLNSAMKFNWTALFELHAMIVFHLQSSHKAKMTIHLAFRERIW